MSVSLLDKNKAFWFVLRDLKRSNAKFRAYHLFKEKDIEIFLPMKWKLEIVQGKRVRKEVPCIPDLLFVHDTRENLDPIIEKNPTIQYRWVRKNYREPMIVPDAEMDRFIHAVSACNFPKYYLPEEITPEMLARPIRIVGGLLDGCEGTLFTTRGSKMKRLLMRLSNLLSVAVEVDPEYIQLI